MARLRPRGSSLFSGLVLILVGVLLLLHNYQGYNIAHTLGHWWPLMLIFWGTVKLYERVSPDAVLLTPETDVDGYEPIEVNAPADDVRVIAELVEVLGVLP